nr:MAG TPA: hypothetical protein [Caudoviricetes sp.]DAW54793.1 MAG TPA: hypothetical protein [Bacteriophage sp.]
MKILYREVFSMEDIIVIILEDGTTVVIHCDK